MTENYAIWWLSQAACEEVEPLHETGNLNLPEYILNQLKSRYGRNGRGRLWIDREIPIDEIPWLDESIACQLVDLHSCGGIVIRLADARLVAFLPGFVIDLDMNLLTLESLELEKLERITETNKALLEALNREEK